MRLYIAEKPSMARELAKCLKGPQQKGNGYIKTGEGTVTWAYGHILEQAEPGEYDERYQKWVAADLPIVPKEWKLLITESSKDQFVLIKSLIEEADEIIHAGDPDREGQLLIDEILDYVHNDKPVRRILMNALDEKSIHESLADLRDNHDFYPLKQSALARSRADWLIGMNLSRAYTLAAQRSGHKVTFPIGRVKTPTLALVVRRQRELDSFVPVDYFTVKAIYDHEAGRMTAQWQPKDTQEGLDSEGRLVKESLGKELFTKLKNQPIGKIMSRQKVKKKEPQRLPLSLSALQVLAGKRFNYDPQTVLDTAQLLYERKLTTYPRSDCDYLPENQRKDSAQILKNLGSMGNEQVSQWVSGADLQIKSRAWNDKKITAHHAIIPTTVHCKFLGLSAVQQNIYLLIARAYITQFYPLHEYEQTKIEIMHDEEFFAVHGRVVLQQGWKELYRQESKEEENGDDGGTLPIVKKGDDVTFVEGLLDKKSTKPPLRFTASTLLAAMKEIHKYVKDERLKKQLKNVSGIGTEATRATIIGELIQRKFIQEEGRKKYLVPTENAYLLIDALPDEMVYPDETAVWEERLQQMSVGKDKLQVFLEDQIAFLTKLVKNSLSISMAGEEAERCPECGQGRLIKRNGKYGPFYGCSDYPKCRYTAPCIELPEQPAVSDYKCPRCTNGYFVKQTGPRGDHWICSAAPACNTRCADVDGKPSIFSQS